jgi:hypothetical protein
MRWNLASLLLLLLPLDPVLAADKGKAPDTATFCTTVWPEQASPSARETTTCRDWWLGVAYGGEVDEDDLELDPPTGQPQTAEVPTTRLERAVAHVRKACGERCTVRDDRALEYLENEIRYRTSLTDPCHGIGISPYLKLVLEGRPIQGIQPSDSRPRLDIYCPLAHRKLRNGVYARHGRIFKDPDLNALFYGASRPEGWTEAGLPLLKQNPKYTDDLLTEADKANIATLQALEQRKNKKESPVTVPTPAPVVLQRLDSQTVEAHLGKLVAVEGLYTPVAVRMRPNPNAPKPRTVSLEGEGGSVMLEIYYSPAGTRSEEEIARFEGRRVRVVGRLAHTPTQLHEGIPMATMTGPYLGDIQSITLVSP